MTRKASALTVAGLAGLVAACGGDDGGTGIAVRRLQDAALLAEGNRSRCPLDLDFPKAISGDVSPQEGDLAAAGTSVGRAPPRSPLGVAGAATYRCGYRLGGKPISFVVVAVPEGRPPKAAVDALGEPVQDAGVERFAAQDLAEAASRAEVGTAVANPSGSAAAATANLPGGGEASVVVVATEGGLSPKDLTSAAEKLAASLQG